MMTSHDARTAGDHGVIMRARAARRAHRSRGRGDIVRVIIRIRCAAALRERSLRARATRDASASGARRSVGRAMASHDARTAGDRDVSVRARAARVDRGVAVTSSESSSVSGARPRSANGRRFGGGGGMSVEARSRRLLFDSEDNTVPRRAAR